MVNRTAVGAYQTTVAGGTSQCLAAGCKNWLTSNATELKLNAISVDPGAPEIRRALTWLLDRQHPGGGWGERPETYWPEIPHGEAPYSAPSQTAWALLGLIAAGEIEHPAVARGIAYLLESQHPTGTWNEPWYTAVGFPPNFLWSLIRAGLFEPTGRMLSPIAA